MWIFNGVVDVSEGLWVLQVAWFDERKGQERRDIEETTAFSYLGGQSCHLGIKLVSLRSLGLSWY